MRGHVGAVLTSGLAALAVAFMMLFALVATHPTAAQAERRAVPWTPVPKAEPTHRDVKPREHHRAPPRNRGGLLPEGPRTPRRAAA